jgi:hypothetical protein
VARPTSLVIGYATPLIVHRLNPSSAAFSFAKDTLPDSIDVLVTKCQTVKIRQLRRRATLFELLYIEIDLVLEETLYITVKCDELSD